MKWICISLTNANAQCSGHASRKEAWASKPCAAKFGGVTRMILKETGQSHAPKGSTFARKGGK